MSVVIFSDVIKYILLEENSKIYINKKIEHTIQNCHIWKWELSLKSVTWVLHSAIKFSAALAHLKQNVIAHIYKRKKNYVAATCPDTYHIYT